MCGVDRRATTTWQKMERNEPRFPHFWILLKCGNIINLFYIFLAEHHPSHLQMNKNVVLFWAAREMRRRRRINTRGVWRNFHLFCISLQNWLLFYFPQRLSRMNFETRWRRFLKEKQFVTLRSQHSHSLVLPFRNFIFILLVRFNSITLPSSTHPCWSWHEERKEKSRRWGNESTWRDRHMWTNLLLNGKRDWGNSLAHTHVY
jgi:hypothetical protein